MTTSGRAGNRLPFDDSARADQLAALHESLATEVAALRSGQDWQHWLATAARFHTYSFHNTLLIAAQRPDATHVAGYEMWKTLGRQVAKGEKGIAILAPIVRRDDDTVSAPNQEPAPPGHRIAGYRVTYVWDLSQTTGTPPPEPPTPTLLAGEAPEGLWDTLAGQVAAAGFTLDRGPCGTANGVTDFSACTVRVRDDVDDAQAVKTFAHELGHVLLHRPDSGEPVVPCRGVAEVEAESVAYLVAASHGLDTSGYTFPYVTSWASAVPDERPQDVVRRTAQRVLTAARTVLGQAAATSLEDPAQAVSALADRSHEAARATAALCGQHTAHEHRVDVTRDNLLAAHAAAQHFYAAQVDGSWAPRYLEGRCLEAALAAPWNAGYAPVGWTTLTEHLRTLGFGEDVLLAAGLATPARTGHLIDRFRDRLVLPQRNEVGEVIAFIGRARPDRHDDRAPRYLNSPETQLYSKRASVFGLHEAAELLTRGAQPVLVEGPLDAIAVTAGTDGRCVGLAASGTAITPDQLDLVARHTDLWARPLVVALDADVAGLAATEQVYWALAERGLPAVAAAILDGTDPADLLRTQGPAALTCAVLDQTRPLADLVIDHRLDPWRERLQWAEGRIGALRAAAPIVAALPTGIARAAGIERLSRMLDLSPDTVRREVSATIGGTPLRAALPTPCCKRVLGSAGSRYSTTRNLAQ